MIIGNFDIFLGDLNFFIEKILFFSDF